MKLYVLRHGKADWPDWDKEDSLRPLTEKGKGELRRAAEFFKQIGVTPDHIVTSPLPRASQTAHIMQYQLGGELYTVKELSPGFEPHRLEVILKRQKDVMIVGHEPDLSAIICHFTGAHVKMSKGGLARLDFENSQQARLIWLLPPKISAR
jgi:phosphohistidine phosphatase